MQRDGLERLAPLAGVLFVALAAAAFIVGGEAPTADDSRAEVLEYWTDNEDEAAISALLVALAMVPYLWFVGTLRSVLRAAEGRSGRLSAIALAGGIVFAAGALLGACVQLTAAETIGDVPADVTQTLSALNANTWPPLAVGNAVLLLSTGVLLLRTGLLPAWVAWVTLLLGIASITPAGFFAFLLTFLWILGMSIVLYVRGGRGDAGPTSATPSPGATA